MSEVPFSATVHQVATGPVLTIRGDLDTHTAPEVLEKIRALTVDRAQVLIVDLGEMRFCDSSGVSAFIAARNRASAAHAGIVLVSVPRQTLRVLTIVGLDALFAVCPSVDAAIAAHQAGGH